MAASVLLLLGLVTAAANIWVVGSINRRVLPRACAQAAQALERKASHPFMPPPAGKHARKAVRCACKLPCMPESRSLVYKQVGVGRVKWVAPSGLVGFGPLAAVGPVELGPGAAEGSSLELPEVVVCVDPLQSLLQRKLVLQLHAAAAQVPLESHDAVERSFGKASFHERKMTMTGALKCCRPGVAGAGRQLCLVWLPR